MKSIVRLKQKPLNIALHSLKCRHFATMKIMKSDSNPHTPEEQRILDEFAEQSLRVKDTVILHGGHRFDQMQMQYLWNLYGYTNLTNAPVPSCYENISASPFSTRLLAYLMYNQIDFIFDDVLSVLPKPMHKIPFITFNGEHIQDTQIMIQHILDPYFGIDNDSHLMDTQRAVSVAFRLALEKQFYWYEIYRRYADPAVCHQYFHTIFGLGKQAKDAQAIEDRLAPLIRDQLWAQGTGRYDGDTVYLMENELIDSVMTHIGDKPFFFGDEMSSIDLVIYGMFGSAYAHPFRMPFCVRYDGEFQHRQIVKAYVERVEQRCRQSAN